MSQEENRTFTTPDEVRTRLRERVAAAESGDADRGTGPR